MKSEQEVEREFDKFMLLNGFTRVSDDVGESPGFSNADYVNKARRIIIELKILNTEFFPDGGVVDALNALMIQPKNIDEKGIGQYTFSLPNINREGKYDNFEEPVRRVLKKANKQIKETKQFYFYTDRPSLSFVILAQVGLTSVGADVTAQIVKKIIFNEFSSINGVIICVPYYCSKNPITLEINPECVSVTDETDIVKKSVCMEIADKWIEFLESGGHS